MRLRYPALLLPAVLLAACTQAGTRPTPAGETPATQSPSPPPVSVASLRERPLATWTPAELEFAFPRWDEIAGATRLVKRGARVHPLPDGVPLAAFQPGGPLATQLDRYVADYKVAGIIVLHDGKIRLERYARGHSATGRWPSFSMAKSMTSTLVGAAIRDGYIRSVDEPLTQYIAALRGSAYEGVTIRQVLTMTSGVKWNEDYTDPTADVALFYSTRPDPGLDATVSYMRRLSREAPPGEKWVYKTGETNLLGVLVAEATGKPLATYLSEKIWAGYGMERDALWQLDDTDHEQGGCCLQATLRDYARFGQFVLDGAQVDGRSIVADGWLAAATRKHVETGRPGIGYGYQWWVRDNGAFYAAGIHGQMIYLDPARRLVIAINSVWPVATGQAESAARLQLLRTITDAIDAEAHRS